MKISVHITLFIKKNKNQKLKEFKKIYESFFTLSKNTKIFVHTNVKIKDILDQNALGVMLSCVSPENYEQNFEEMKSLGVPFGFKFNAFQTTKPKGGYTNNYGKSNGNPNEFLGQRTDLNPIKIAEFAKKFKDGGATILGGCCETRPSHIKEIAKLK